MSDTFWFLITAAAVGGWGYWQRKSAIRAGEWFGPVRWWR